MVISPVPAIPVFLTKVLGRGTSAVCPPKHSWDGIETNYIRWPVYPVGPAAKWLKNWPGLFLTLGWGISKRRFIQAARRFAPDVVFAHHGQLGGFAAAEIARSLNVPFFVTEHNFNDIASCETNVRRRRHYSHVTRGIGKWIAVANRMLDSMRLVFPDVPATVVHNGAERLPTEFKDCRAPPAILEGRLVVLCVTFFYKRKNVPLLIEAFDDIASRHPRALLVIGGDGEDSAAIQAAVGEAKQGSQVLLLGPMAHKDVLQHMVWCDIFALIGIDEPFGVVFTEAMMAGKPIIYCNDGGITDVVVSETHGLGVAPGDRKGTASALDRLLADSGLRDAARKCSRRSR